METRRRQLEYPSETAQARLATGGGKKWLESWYMLKVMTSVLMNQMWVCEKSRIKNGFKFSKVSKLKGGAVIT